MALSFKTDDSYGYAMLPLFGVAPGLIEMAKDHGVSINQQSPGNFAVTYGNQVFGIIPIKGQAITLAKAGTLGPASKQAIRYQFEQAISKAIDATQKTTVLKNPQEDDAESSVDLGKLLKKKLKESEPVSILNEEATADSVGVSDVSPSNSIESVSKKLTTGAAAGMMQKTPVPLFKATNCGQPVKGTSHSSVYYVVARFQGLNLAIRAKGGRLSCRAEGKKLNAYLGSLGELGFSDHDAYASVHFEISEQSLMMKTVGAIVSRIGFNELVEVIDPNMVWGK